ncbi:MAG: KEOPS complex subunit Cgi121 [Methanobacterium sp.]|uniref:KEOPS complex subunit Cgi121 n=1 Tax=Methanobacterium sp. TaxID=2164 RepID=UPI003C795137
MVEIIQTNNKIEEFNIQIAGFKSEIKDFKKLINELAKLNNGCIIQLMNAEGIAGRKHAANAAIHAIKSFSRNENIANSLGLEICVRTSGQRQISQALKMLGITSGNINVCAVAIGCDDTIMQTLTSMLGERDDAVLEPEEDKLKKLYNITEIEVHTAGNVSNLLIERTALLITET